MAIVERLTREAQRNVDTSVQVLRNAAKTTAVWFEYGAGTAFLFLLGGKPPLAGGRQSLRAS